MATQPRTTRVIGAPTPRADGAAKVTGAAKYAMDVPVPQSVWGKTLRSPIASGRIVRIDTSKAKAMPGVYAVITGDDLPPNTRFGRRIVDTSPLAQGIVRFIGEQVAAVAAVDEDTAQEALGLIDVEYEELTPLLDPEEAMRPGAPFIHPEVPTYLGLVHPLDGPTNVVVHNEWGKGDVEKGFAQADLVIEHTYNTPMQHQVYMEPHCCTVAIAGDGAIEVWAPNKAPYAARNQVAQCIGVEPNTVVFHPVTIGGDFGGKGSPMNIPLCYFLAKAAGCPVQMAFDYFDEFLAANPRHATKIRVKTGVKRDGTITAHEAHIILNSGAYAGFKPVGFLPGVAGAGGPYRTENGRVISDMVYTNNVPCGHMRGPGEPQGLFALESHIDAVARAIRMDPADFRLKNVVRGNEADAIGHSYEDLMAAQTLETALKTADYYAPKAPNVGRGIAIGERAPGGGTTHVGITLNEDGSLTIQTPIFEQGSGTYTLLEQVIAEVLDFPIERMSFSVWDTGAVPTDSGVGGSRVTRIATQAAHIAAGEVKAEVFKLAAELLGWPEEKLVFKGERVSRGDTGESTSWTELIRRTGTPITARGHVEDTTPAKVTGFTAQIAEVSVDPESGQVKLLKMTSVHDAGKVMNPIGYMGQVNGGTMMGIGYGLMEELVNENGRVTTLSFAEYKIPNIIDIPEMQTVVLESESGVGPYNVKGIGENANAPTAAAIANAVEDACGIRIRNLPIAAEKVYRALRNRAST